MKGFWWLLGTIMGLLAIVGLALLVAAFIFASFAFSGWLLMLVFGALGHAFGVEAFFISFWQSVLLVAALSLVGSFFRGTSS